MKKYKNYLTKNNTIEVPISTLRRRIAGELKNTQNESQNELCELLRGNNNSEMEYHEQLDSNELLSEMDFENEELLNQDETDDFISSLGSSPSSSLNSLLLFEENYLQDDINMEPTDNTFAWMDKELYPGSPRKLGETIHELISLFFKNGLTKVCLENILFFLQSLLPQPNNLVKNKYYLFKLLDTLLPSGNNLIKKHQMCENCSHYIGPLPSCPPITECTNCKSTKVNDVFIEYDLKQVIKDSFEVRDLKRLIEIHSEENENLDSSVIKDFTSASKYKTFKQGVLKNKYDVCLLWNTDGSPVSKSSNGQIWPIQVKIMNIPPDKRRSYQFLTGLYYTHETKPPMNSFLKPFTDALKDLHENGIEWFDKSTQTMMISTVIAPIASLDCPARATVQNLMRFNGENGCTTCEHPGMTCRTGLGHARVYPFSRKVYSLRTKERMLEQANLAASEELQHVKGVKGAAIAATIPFFDWATSFVCDYMHATLLGVARMLFELWFDGGNCNRPFYIHKKQRDEIDHEIKQISPPDFIVRTPCQLKYRHYWKASVIRDFLLYYFPILLKDKLQTKYYKHFLFFIYGTRILLQDKIHTNEIQLAESLLNTFALQISELYGLEKCTYNVHQLTHMARQVRMWGPLWSWSAFSFEDGIGYFKKLNNGPNKVDVEICNTLKIFNAFYILKDKLQLININEEHFEKVLGKVINYVLNEHELDALQSIDFPQETYIFQNNVVHAYSRAVIGKTKLTSQLYTRQKKGIIL